MGQTKGKRTGPGLKPGKNEADTGSVVNTVTSHNAVMGRSAAAHPTAAGNPRGFAKRPRSR